MYSGNARSQGMYGRSLEGEYRNTATMWLISSCSSNICWRQSHQNWTGGQSRLGVSGMHEIDTTSGISVTATVDHGKCNRIVDGVPKPCGSTVDMMLELAILVLPIIG